MIKIEKLPAKVVCTPEEYHQHYAVGSSGLRTIIDFSPAHYLYERENPSPSTPAQVFGTAVHQAILEPNKFQESIAIEPEFSGKGSVALRAQWHLENHGRTIMKTEQADQVRGILKALRNHSRAWKYVATGRAEESLFWEDPDTHVVCKARPDFMHDGHVLVDVKTTTNASYWPFQKTIAEYGYHIQAALYLDGATQVFGREFDEFVIVAVEKDAPHGINCFLITEEMLTEGRALYKDALRTLAGCIKSGKFPSYPEALLPAALPSWAYKRTGPYEE